MNSSSSSSSPRPPPPLDDPTISDPLKCPPLMWGILGCGRVSHDFCQALKHLPAQRVVACAARSLDCARAFATKHHNLGAVYGSYQELVNNKDVQIVYVGNVHSLRRETGELCLKANKHVLLEKPFACSTQDAEYLIQLAKERNLFLMEGMWTRFFPAVQKSRDLVMQDQVLGDIATVLSDFNFCASDTDEYPSSLLYQRKLGGGANLFVGPYLMATASLFFNGRVPSTIKAVGQVDDEMGVELQVAATLNYSATGLQKHKNANGMIHPKLPGAGVAVLSFGMLCETSEETVVVGAKGRLKIHGPSHCPTKVTVALKAEGRGQVGKTLEFDYPLPQDTPEIIEAGGFFYPNSAGFCYEAAAVARCIAAGKTQAPQFTLEETLINLNIIEEIRDQLGVKPIWED